jgi:hypothetical protein
MDSSIVRLQPAAQGALDGQWRLTDTRLSLRHLCWGPQVAWQPARRWLGIALQAEHDDPSTRAQAPVLALFDGQQLQVQPLPAGTALAGYGGDIGCDGQHFAVSCPRADQLTWWQPRHAPANPCNGTAAARCKACTRWPTTACPRCCPHRPRRAVDGG